MKTHLFLSCLIITAWAQAQNTVCFTVENNPNPTDPALAVFTKYVDVFGCSIYAEDGVSDEKVLHAAAIFAELLDNDEDSIVDDPALLAELQSSNAMMPVFEADGNAAMNTFFNNYNGDGVSAVLWQSEMDPSQPGHWGSDATIEEILHTINHVGHTNLYPSAFDLSPNSSLMTDAMDVARGGQFLTVPASYPAAAWYHYDDVTCDYGCMAIEYLYWSIVSLMGILDDPGTCAGIANEWEPCTPALFQSTDTLMYQLITDPQYLLPQSAPDGNYCPTTPTKINETTAPAVNVFPNPSNGNLTIAWQGVILKPEVTILNSLGQVVGKTLSTRLNNQMQLDLSHLPPGIYFVQLDNYEFRKLLID